MTKTNTFENQNLRSNKNYFIGTLLLSDNDSDILDYGVCDTSIQDESFTSITDLLNKVYSSPTLQIKIEIKQLDNNHKIFRIGKLHISKDKYGIEDWYVGSFPLGTYLSELTEKRLEILIEDFMELENMEITEAEVDNGRTKFKAS